MRKEPRGHGYHSDGLAGKWNFYRSTCGCYYWFDDHCFLGLIPAPGCPEYAWRMNVLTGKKMEREKMKLPDEGINGKNP